MSTPAFKEKHKDNYLRKEVLDNTDDQDNGEQLYTLVVDPTQ